MLNIRTRLKMNSRVKIHCDKHTRYNPEKEGRGGVKGACARCEFMYAVYATQQTMLNAARDFQQMTQLYEQIKPRVVKTIGSPQGAQ
jgi:hypothetical protein